MSGTLPNTNSGFTPAAVTASQTGTTVPLPPRAPPSPSAVFLFRVTAMLRIASMLNPIGILIYDAVFFDDVCNHRTAECWKIWHATFIIALVALCWDIAVTVSLIRILRGRPGIPYIVHANIACLVALGVTACFCFVTAQVARRAMFQPFFASLSMIGLMAVLMIFCWNDVVWAIFGWKWMRKHKVDMLEMYGGSRD